MSNLSQLVRCLPSVCLVEYLPHGECMFVLERELEPAEVDTVKAYARRVRNLVIGHPDDLDPDTLGHLCRSSQTEPLFPNLRKLHLSVANDAAILLPHVIPKNLRELSLSFLLPDPSSYGDFLRSLSSSCPGIRHISVAFSQGWRSTTFSNIMIPNVRCWTHLQSMYCPDMIMDIDTFLHLSHLPSLTKLSFTLDPTLIDQNETSNHAFVLPTLQEMNLYITSMLSDSKFLTRMRLPALRSISMHYLMSPPRDMIRSFEMTLRAVSNHKLVTEITLDGSASNSPLIMEPAGALVLEDLLPFAAFNLTIMHIDLDCIIDMEDNDLLRLASDCPRIRFLSINFYFGWRSAGITPVSLVKVLRLCPSLSNISIALDTHGSRIPHYELESGSFIGGGLGDPLPSGRRSMIIHLTDSVIEAESVPALAAFFADCMPSGAMFSISGWESNRVRRLHDNWKAYETRWRDVSILVEEIVTERSKRLCSRGEE